MGGVDPTQGMMMMMVILNWAVVRTLTLLFQLVTPSFSFFKAKGPPILSYASPFMCTATGSQPPSLSLVPYILYSSFHSI